MCVRGCVRACVPTVCVHDVCPMCARVVGSAPCMPEQCLVLVHCTAAGGVQCYQACVVLAGV